MTLDAFTAASRRSGANAPSLLAARRIRIAALLVVTCAALSGAAHAGRLPVPEGTQLSPLGDRMRINGQESRLSEFRYPGRREELIRYYREQFRAAGGLQLKPKNGVEVMAGIIDDSYVTVQIQLGSGDVTYGRIMQTALTQRKPYEAADRLAPMPPESKPLSQVESQDGDRLSRITVYANQHSIASNHDFVADDLKSRGYRIASGDDQTEARGRVTWFSGTRGEQALLTIRDSGEERVVTLNVTSRLAAYDDRSTP